MSTVRKGSLYVLPTPRQPAITSRKKLSRPVLSAACMSALSRTAKKIQASALARSRSSTTRTSATGPRILLTGGDAGARTAAVSALTAQLGAGLLHIDLARVVSKYIGETEKNLRRLLADAASTGVVLFFDEADALFGKRTGVKDSHDRYANLEVGYLLAQIEKHPGVVVLATNKRPTGQASASKPFGFVIAVTTPRAARALPARKA